MNPCLRGPSGSGNLADQIAGGLIHSLSGNIYFDDVSVKDIAIPHQATNWFCNTRHAAVLPELYGKTWHSLKPVLRKKRDLCIAKICILTS